jgi:hypothetical protein
MAIHFRCPHCKRPMKAPERFVGRQAICPGCKTELIVPENKPERGSAQGKPLKRQAEGVIEDMLQSLIETGEFEDEAEAVRRELDEAES